MFTLIHKRTMVAILVVVMLVVSILALIFALYYTPTQGVFSPGAQSPGTNIQLASSGSTTNINTQDPRFCIVPLEGIERLTGKESTH